jgi:hypothetical protein
MATFRMKHRYVPFAFLSILMISVFVAEGFALLGTTDAVNGTFTITTTTPSTDGFAFKISDPSITETAAVTLDGNYRSVGANGNVKLHVTSGSITIGSNTYTVQNGKGAFDPTTGRIIIVARVNVQHGGQGRQLILFGYVSTNGYNNLGGPVTFTKPQSKLSGAYFLAINANLALT